MFNISMRKGTDDAAIFAEAINQGIDSRLEGFTKSQFDDSGDRLSLDFDESELSILIRRLDESGNPYAEMWASDIVTIQYGVEII